MNAALIMAGGKSSRMRAWFAGRHKALVPILGVPMLERNLIWLLSMGFRELYLAIAAQEQALGDFAQTRCQTLATGFGAKLSLIVESAPLGTVGASRLCNTKQDLAVVNVDNLTALDLRAMLELHRESGAAMTIATHREAFRMPFGQVLLEDRRVVDVLEKPTLEYQISSGTYVLSPRACQAIPPEVNIGVPELFQRLKDNDEIALAFHHSAPWIDVNDGEAALRAESLIIAHYRDFECPWNQPNSERLVVLAANSRVLVEGTNSHFRVGLELRPGATPESAARACAYEPRFLLSFDEPRYDGQVTRFHLFIDESPVATGSSGSWLTANEIGEENKSDLARCLAYWHFDSARRAKHQS